MSLPARLYPWALSKEKIERAVAQLEKTGKKYTEKQVKALYVSFAGALRPSK